MSGYLTVGVTEMTDSVAHFLKKGWSQGLCGPTVADGTRVPNGHHEPF